MVGKSKTPTKAEARRMGILKMDVGCIACRLDGRGYEPPDIHHLLNGYRIGHSATIPLCRRHHDAVKSPEFKKAYGSDHELLEMTNAFVEQVEASIIGRVT